ncbi:MAG: 50S ribosomal protein L11 methyltransferase, partial [Bacteroidota bacterium]
QDRFPFFYQKKLIKYQNWNAIWESNFKPIVVGTFCGIRADFHSPLTEVQHEIIINPKMAFGTGHHETTWMMIAAMKKLDFSEKKILDYGCGTGILAILVSQLGAEKIDALDIELPSYENTIENAAINRIQNIEAIHGTLPKIQHLTYDIILANINRHVILENLSTLHNMLPIGGTLLISGILNTDKSLVQHSAEKAGFTYESINDKNNWICMQLKK